MADPLDNDPGLARAGAGDHDRGPILELDDPTPLGREDVDLIGQLP
ncbi:MAG: hypothetical protein WKF78_14925 [Candidatus Limnocylindrales bacterium]